MILLFHTLFFEQHDGICWLYNDVLYFMILSIIAIFRRKNGPKVPYSPSYESEMLCVVSALNELFLQYFSRSFREHQEKLSTNRKNLRSIRFSRNCVVILMIKYPRIFKWLSINYRSINTSPIVFFNIWTPFWLES